MKKALNTQINDVNQKLLNHDSRLQELNDEIADINDQLNQAKSSLERKLQELKNDVD